MKTKLLKISRRKKSKFIPIKRRLIAICILFAMLPLLIVNYLSYYISENALRSTSKQLTTQMINQISINVNTYTIEVEKDITQFIVSNLVESNSLLRYFSDNLKEKLEAEQNITKSVKDFANLNNSVESVVVIFNDDCIFSNRIDINRQDILAIRDFKEGGNLVWKKGIGAYSDSIFVIKELIAPQNKGTCTVCIEVNKEDIATILKDVQLLDNSPIILMDNNRNIIFSNQNDNAKINEEIWTRIIS